MDCSAQATRTTAILLAAAAFVTIYVVPSLKYPANPPSVGIAETIGYRTQLFFAMIAITMAAMIIAVMVAKNMVAMYGPWNATLIGGGVFGLPTIWEQGMLLQAVDKAREREKWKPSRPEMLRRLAWLAL